MESLLTILTEAKDWVILVSAVAFMIIFWEPIAQKFGYKKNRNGNGNGYKSLEAKIHSLSLHYNHETTDLLTDIKDDVNIVAGGIRDANIKLDILLRK